MYWTILRIMLILQMSQTDLQTMHLQNYADSFVLITKPQALHLTQQYKYFKAIETPADGAFE